MLAQELNREEKSLAMDTSMVVSPKEQDNVMQVRGRFGFLFQKKGVILIYVVGIHI